MRNVLWASDQGDAGVVALSFSSAPADLKVGATMFFISLLEGEGPQSRYAVETTLMIQEDRLCLQQS